MISKWKVISAMDKSKIKAISLYSGGLDSILAIKIVLEAANQGLDIIPIKFFTPFFNYRNEQEKEKERSYLREKFHIELRLIDLTDEFLKILAHPYYGYGKNLNPCIDCRILMLKKAKEVMEKEHAAFILTGEVAGQRPKSQKMDKMKIIEKQAGLNGYVLRPLSAKLLDFTKPEKENIINRSKLFDISGRSRYMQMKLAKKHDIKYFTTPSGGCLLTDPEYARRLKVIMGKAPLDAHIANCLRWGRAFIIGKKLLIVGRNDFENKKLLQLAREKDLLIQPKKIPGPICLFIENRNFISEELNQAVAICAKFTIKETKKIKVQYGIKQTLMDSMENLKNLELDGYLETIPMAPELLGEFKV